MMQLANSTFYMSGAQARLSSQSNSSSTSAEGGAGGSEGPSTAAVIRLRKSENPRRPSSRASVASIVHIATSANEEEVQTSPDEIAQSSSSAPISPTLSPSSRLMLKRKQLNASLALRSHPFSTSPSACSTSSSAASSLVSFGSTSSKSNSLKRGSPEQANLASRLRNLQISELIDAILLVEGKLKKEQKMIAREIRSRDLQISQQLKEIERYRLERKQNLCGFCQKKMDNVSSSQKPPQHQQMARDRVAEMKCAEVQTEVAGTGQDVAGTGFKGASSVLRRRSSARATAAATFEEAVVVPDDDWYANANSDNENEKNAVNLYERGVNPVLERVNQILLQESMDTSNDDAATRSAEVMHVRAAAPLPHSVLLQKQQQQLREQQIKLAERMQTTRIPEIRKAATTTTTPLSTAPIGKCAPIVMKRPPHKLTTSSPVHPPILMRAHSSPMSTSSRGGRENEYEVIGSEQDSSNYYMEMQSPIDAKSFLMSAVSASDDKGDEVEYKNVLSRKEGLELLKLIAPHAGQPPALPPKPANLMKFKKVAPPPTSAKIVTAMSVNVPQIAKSQLVKSAPEPDYCSISECGANSSTKASSSVGGRGEEDNEETASSRASEDTLENIIKLPNVAAIIVPKNNPNGNANVGGGSCSSMNNSMTNSSSNRNGNHSVFNKENYISKSVMSVKPLSPGKLPGMLPSGGLMALSSPPIKAKESVRKDLPLMSGGSDKRFHSSPLRSSLNAASSLVEKRQNLLHRLSIQQQHSHHGMMMKRYSMDALSPQIQPEELKGSGGTSSGLFEERIPIQAEFDWYNLDAEFGKFNAQDVIKEAKSSGSESGSVSGGDEERGRERQRPSAKLALDRGLGELKDIERKMSTLERKRAIERQDGASKEMVHFC